MLKLFWLPEDSRDKNWGSLPASFPGLGAPKVHGGELSEEAACPGSKVLWMLNLFLFYCNFKDTVNFLLF